MVKKRDWRLVSRSIFGPIILLLLVAGAYAAVIYGFSHFEYDSEWRSEQENFETLAANAVFEKQRLAASAESAQTYTSKYSLGTNDVYGIISGFLNKTMLTVETYTFKWTKSLSFKRMYDHAFQLSDDSDLKFCKPSTKIIDIIFRSILPIFTTFAVGASVSAIHSIVTNVLQICIRHKKHEAWTVGRNRMLRVNVVAAMVVAIVYFVVCFFLITLACTRWQDVSYADGVKITINLIATLPPKVKQVSHLEFWMYIHICCYQTSIIDAHTLAALSFVIHSGTAYVIFTLINLMKTWRISEFSIPLIKDIDQADQVDKNMQVQYKMKRAEVLQKNVVENLEQKKVE
ncbi:hypothetical protein CRE_05106 [Caenorhabditis remanei]|uniref:Uncharacterized protein n=1 Tax=Caenorhabditis remanei TaxID=31234 RepID=E3MZ75_CAERE|nr:hypothetical protein CRE_05106 [Caenorhabditis remanei]